jgi:hypothetical protein
LIIVRKRGLKLSVYNQRPRLKYLYLNVSDWFLTEGYKICYKYERRKHHYVLWRMCPIRIKPDTFRRMLCQLAKDHSDCVGQENGYYWVY